MPPLAVVKIALSLFESNCGEVIELASVSPLNDSINLQYIGQFPHCLIFDDVLPHKNRVGGGNKQ